MTEWLGQKRHHGDADDCNGARNTLSAAIDSGLCSPSTTSVTHVEIKARSFVSQQMSDAATVHDHVSRSSLTGKQDNTNAYLISQSHSRGSLLITSNGLDALLSHINAMPPLAQTLGDFARTDSDFYIGRAGVHFSSPRTGAPNRVLELCCNLKHVEANGSGRNGPLAWSIRQMAIYQAYDIDSRSENLVLINTSNEAKRRIKEAFKDDLDGPRPFEHWAVMLQLMFASIVANWREYLVALHIAVMEIRNDAVFAQVSTRGKEALPIDRLKEAMMYDELLEQASHVLQNNLQTIAALKEQVHDRQKPSPVRASTRTTSAHATNEHSASLLATLDDVSRTLTFTRNQIELISKRLAGSSIRDIVTLQSTYSMERMTQRSIEEARSVRIIAIVTLLYLPPTFTATLLGMGYLTVTSTSASGALELRADPTGLFYLAITLPLMAVTLLSWFAWQWLERRRAKRRDAGRGTRFLDGADAEKGLGRAATQPRRGRAATLLGRTFRLSS